jgi:redox-sensitive bicupin YhaK (pirin superfamily)
VRCLGDKEIAMPQSIALAPAAPVQQHARRIVHRTRGRRHGPITRLMSPGDLGEALKPFVFLDLFDTDGGSFSGFGLHPHSGIATLTHLLEGSVRYEDTTGATGILARGGVEWFKAGQGAWHGGGSGDDGRTRGFQLWLALPPEHELGPVESLYQAPADLQRDGPALVLLGGHGQARSPLSAPAPINYLAVSLKAGESWRYQPPAGHTVAWIALGSGRLAAGEPVEAGELVVFERSAEAIEFHAETDAEFMLGSAAPHPHDLVLGYYSVHTSPAALQAGERRIQEVRARLVKDGRL